MKRTTLPLALAGQLAALPLGCGSSNEDGNADEVETSESESESTTSESTTSESTTSESETTGETETTSESSESETTGETGGEALSLTILHINDHHSHLDPGAFEFDVSELGLTATADAEGTPLAAVEVTYGGMPMLAGLFDQLAAARENVVRIHAGDAISGTLYYTLFHGEADARMMNEICFDAFALGNHEFDDGDAGLAQFLDWLAEGDCDTPVLAANVVPHAASPLVDGYLQPYVIHEVGGQQIGMIGIDIAQKTKESSQPDEDTIFLDEAETAQQYIDELEAMGINKIVLVTHYQYAQDVVLAGNLRGVDVIVGGDSHTLLGGPNLAELGFQPGGEYPTITTDMDGSTVCVVQAWEYAHLLGELQIDFDAEGVVTSCSGAPRMPIDGLTFSYDYVNDAQEDEVRALEGADIDAVVAALTAYDELVVVEADADATMLLSSFAEQVEILEQTVIGSASDRLCRERFPGQGHSGDMACTLDSYEHGSDIANLVAKAFMTVTPTADICIQNAGGVRVTVESGDYTIADAFTLLPFSNTLVTLDMTGEQIIDVLEDALSNHLDGGGSTGSYPYASGLRFDVDASEVEGARVSNVEINPRLESTWAPIDENAVYTVVANDFIAQGLDGYDTFGVVWDMGAYVNTYTEYAQGWIDFVEVASPLAALPESELSTQQYIGRDGCNHSAQLDCLGY